MPKVRMVDDITIPSEMTRVNFQGKNPFVVCNMFPTLLRDIMKISSKDIFETDIRWDITADPRPFYGVWMGRRREDLWTETRIRILAQGEQTSRDKTGWIRVMIKGTVETEYLYSNFIQKSFWWFYNYMFYYRQRRRYLDWASDNVKKMKEKVMLALEIIKEE